jgi:hypothetical protein
MSTGEGHAWSKVVVGLPCKRNTTPGLEQVMLSRSTTLDSLALEDLEGDELTYEQLLSIGKGPSYDKRRRHEAILRQRAEETQAAFRERIIDLDPSDGEKTFDGGFDAIVAAYRQGA